MPRIKLWDEHRSYDYKFIDRQVQNLIDMGGTGIYVHKYIGPKNKDVNESDITTFIDDVVFMENRSRRYDEVIYELTGHYNPQDAEFDLSQFGIFLSNDTIFVEFHLNEMVNKIGRKLMSGDVIELPHLREFYSLQEDLPAFNKFFVIEDAARSSDGFDPRWWPHIWRVKASAMTASEEFEDIIGSKGKQVVKDNDGIVVGTIDAGKQGHGSGQEGDSDDGSSLIDIISSYNAEQCISDQVQEEAKKEVPHDPKFFDTEHLYIQKNKEGKALIYPWSGDGKPPNGEEFKGEGDKFPKDMKDGEYFLRTDFDPPTLYQKDGCKFTAIEIDRRQPWTGQHRIFDDYIDNDRTMETDDGKKISSKQALSKVVKPGEDD